MRKRILTMAAATIMTFAIPLTSFAGMMGYWRQDSTGWWWQWLDGIEGRWIKNQWKWIDGDMDGIVECYYFGPDGYLYTDTTTPDGYTVNADGAWTVDGVVQSRTFSLYTDDFSVPMEDVSGAVTDPNAVAQITINEEIWKPLNNWNSTAPIDMNMATPLEEGYYQYMYNGMQLKVHAGKLKNTEQYVIASLFGPAKAFLNNIPAQGIEARAFFTNSGLEDPYGDMGGHVHGSTGNLDRVFDTPVSQLRVLEVKYNNGQMRHLWIQLTPGSDGEWYVYPDSSAYLV